MQGVIYYLLSGAHKGKELFQEKCALLPAMRVIEKLVIRAKDKKKGNIKYLNVTIRAEG